jgi:RHS repeat-associated protein
LDKTGLTCAGAPYDFVVSALFSTCQQPSCFCEQQFGNPNCICHAVVSTPLNNLHLTVPKALIPGCAPPPDFCSEGGGAGGGGGAGPGGAWGGAAGAIGPGGTGGAMALTGSKGNGPDSGAAGTTGGGSCQTCKALGSSAGDGSGDGGSGCGFSVGGGGSSCMFKAAGAHLRYGAGGVGGPGFPGSAGVTANPWNTTLGRYWSQDWAERIVMDPDESHVWLLTRFGSFREFGGLAAGSGLRLYQTVTPGDEYRKLYYDSTAQGWQLQGLDGSVESFLPKTAGSPAGMLAGFLDKITDRLYDPANPVAHPPVQASYNASNQLDHVTLPDGRRENFTYVGGASGKLASLTEVGTDGTTTRAWTFTWTGDDLTTIGRPDVCSGLSAGTSWQLSYGDANHPGYVTQVRLLDCHNNSRIEAGFGYDTSGNVVMAWRGDPFFNGKDAADWYQLSFDSPALPAVTTMQTLIKRTVVGGANQDTLQTGTCTLDRDPGRAGAHGTRKARVKQVTGECPSCIPAANPAFTYADPANPLLPTTVTDGRGVAMSFSFDANGRQLTKIETVETTPSLVQRQTTWTYNATFPSFVSTVTGPFSPPGTPPAGTRSLALSYDPKGNLSASTISGAEATYPTGTFSLPTAYRSYSAAGLPGSIDPPDVPSTTADATTYTFKPGATNGYLVATRSDPVIGAPPLNATTSFQYDAFNRPTDVTDVNGMTTHTTYDALNRVLTVTQGFGSAQPLTTTYNYDSPTDALGDLICLQLPAGNAIAYGYDGAGRVSSISRQASCSATQPLEQTLYTQDAASHRILEIRQRLVGGSPVTDATTSYSYSRGVVMTRQLDPADRPRQVTYTGDPTLTTTYAYDTTAATGTFPIGPNACQGTTTPIVISTPSAPTVYSAGGPLQQLHLANGIAETHTFDQRYYPTAISAGTLLAWSYTTDAIGNVTVISPGRNFAYQDFQYFLIQANAPTLWGTRTWSYDTIGNRLSEDRGGGAKDTYTYQANAAIPQGDTPLLKTISLANNAGTKYFIFDRAGNELLEASPTSHLEFNPDPAGKLTRMTEATQKTTTTLAYDGRGFLAKARSSVTDCGPLLTTATYSSDGMLYYRQQQALFTGAVQAQTRIFYFAGRPVAQLDDPPSTGTLLYLTTDHLGTPILASTTAAVATWSGGFEPFGRDFTNPSAQSAKVFLRLPGQWDDPVWTNSKLNSGLYYNVNRWYEAGLARYRQADPVGITDRAPNLYAYVSDAPLRFSDPLGLKQWPFGGGLFCNDKSCSCIPPPPIKVLGEDTFSFVATPAPGQCVESDAVYSAKGVVKIPDNFRCTLKCEGGHGTLTCIARPPVPGIVPTFYPPGKDLPPGWPVNPFPPGGGQ